jgi:RHS repeat-associated protein
MTGYSAALNGGTVSGALNWNPNGSLQQLVIADPFSSADVQTCSYGADDLSRIASVNCMSGTTNVWAQNFTYDAFGNITKQVPTNGTGISWIPGYNASTNRYTLGGTSYDANGNLLNDTFNTYTWDADGKTLSTAHSNGQTYSFVYDAFGHEVEWSSNSTYEGCNITIGNYKLSARGQTPFYDEYPYPGGSLTSEGAGLTAAQMADWQGTSRAAYSYTGGNWIESIAHAPFGETYVGKSQNFTGQWSDADTTNTTYYFPERQYRSSQGRWLSPDPAGPSAVDPSSPQSWNRYAYVLNNPLSLTDPMGLWCVWGDKSHDPDPNPFDPEAPSNGPKPQSGDAGSGGGATQGQCAAQGGYWDPFDIVTGCDDNTGRCTTNDGSTAYICPGGLGVCDGPFQAIVSADAPSDVLPCFVRGAAVGVGGALVVAGGVVLAGAVGVPAAVTSGVLLLAGGIGGGLTVASGIASVKSGNYSGAAYDVGSIAGGVGAGSAVGGVVADSIKAPATRGFSLGRAWAIRYRSSKGLNPIPFFATGPDAQGAAGAIAGAASKLAAFLRGPC